VTASCTGQALHSELCVEIKHASALSMSNAEYNSLFSVISSTLPAVMHC